jgi:hypothetical protein
MSFVLPADGEQLDGNNTLTQFIDWSAKEHNTLYVTGGDETFVAAAVYQPIDNFNGVKVAASAQPMGETVYRQVADFNRFHQAPDGVRTLIDLLAPGAGVITADIGNPIVPPVRSGTSFAAPHVTGTVALLQEYGNTQPSSMHWTENYKRHEVMKAVVMNSADKLIDDGMVEVNGVAVPRGGLLGMERTVIKRPQPGVPTPTWLDSMAYDDSIEGQGQFFPLDEEMGTGHLNAKRAYDQFRPGEWDSNAADVPVIGWDYGSITGLSTGPASVRRYRFDQELRGESFVSITLAWDRLVEFVNDADADGAFDAGDAFEDAIAGGGADPPADNQINDLDLYLLPSGAGDIDEALAASIFNEGTVEHLFYQIPETGAYEFWMWQRDTTESTMTQDYGVAWWAAGTSLVGQGDFNNDQIVDGADLAQWTGDFGVDDGSDADNDGDSDGGDFLVWQRNFGTGVPAVPANASIPEPATWILAVVGLPWLRHRLVVA